MDAAQTINRARVAAAGFCIRLVPTVSVRATTVKATPNGAAQSALRRVRLKPTVAKRNAAMRMAMQQHGARNEMSARQHHEPSYGTAGMHAWRHHRARIVSRKNDGAERC